MSVQERVARGARWLDRVSPGWRDAIALSALDIVSNTHCVLGQVFSDAAASGKSTSGTEYAVRNVVPGLKSRDWGVCSAISALESLDCRDWLVAHGFASKLRLDESDRLALNNAWSCVICGRRDEFEARVRTARS
ncbi:MAG: hypothetical protein QOE87_2583 [Gaiellales bacterium]|nr:hypothetical protein [Gaiellales bacterium]